MTRDRTVLLVVHTGTRGGDRNRAASGKGARRQRHRPPGCCPPKQSTGGRCIWRPTTCGRSGCEIEVVDADERAAEGCELVLVLGGDGTFLRAAVRRQRRDPGAGSQSRQGRLPRRGRGGGDRHRARPCGQARLPRRGADDARRRGARQRADRDRGWALNEASLEKGPRLGVLGVVLEVDGRPVSEFGCDGVLVSTPTGSTAYAFSADGPILWPDSSRSWWYPTTRTRCSPGRW